MLGQDGPEKPTGPKTTDAYFTDLDERSSLVEGCHVASLGRYWRSSPLVFFFDPNCHGLLGSQK